MSKDLFSTQADAYKAYRPVYPQALFEYILSFVKDRDCALDVATGNGQAAVVLARYFKQVYATDISAAQLANAEEKENIIYQQEPAEQTSFKPRTFDLITVAQAYHWLNHEAFALEATRIAKPGAIMAVWMYDRPKTGDTKLDSLLDRFYFDITGPYWDAARKAVDDRYSTLLFPYTTLPGSTFAIEARWTPRELIGYLSSWSAVQHYQKASDASPLSIIQNEVEALMGLEPVLVRFPVILRLGRIGAD